MPKKDTRLIQQIKLNNLLSFGPDTPALELENLNVLIGPNGSGKSNLIDCIELIRALPGDLLRALRKIGGSADLVWKGYDILPWEKPNVTISTNIGLLLSNRKKSLNHFLNFGSEAHLFWVDEERIQIVNTAVNVIPTRLFTRNPNKSTIAVIKGNLLKTEEIETNFGSSVLGQLKDYTHYKELTKLGDSYSSIRIYRDWDFGRSSNLRKPQPADMPTDHLMEDLSNLGLYLNKIRRYPTVKKQLLEGLQDLYDGIDDFDVKIEGNTVQVFFVEGDYIIPATRLSDGTLHYLCLLAILLDPEPPPLICIEEPEMGLHPDILPGLARLLVSASERTQLIVTTHSDILVDALSEQPESVVVCEKHDGKTEMNRLKREDLSVWLEKYRLGELWIDGEIGGKRW